MQTFAFRVSDRRRRLAWAGALFLALDAVLMGGAVWWISAGRHPGLAIALATAGLLVSAVLAMLMARPPRAFVSGEVLVVEAGFQRLAVALPGARVGRVDLRSWPAARLPEAMRAPRWWQAGDAQGWQRDAEGRWFAALPTRGPAIAIEAADGERVVVAPLDADALRRALLGAGARES